MPHGTLDDGSQWHTTPCSHERHHTMHYPQVTLTKDGRIHTARLATRTTEPSHAQAQAAAVMLAKAADEEASRSEVKG